MKDQFRGFLGYDDNEIRELWENAVFVVDTNILINFYKYTSKASTQSLLGILKNLKDSHRLFIPHQVALEYFFNYEVNMSKQHEGFKFLNTELLKLKESAVKVLNRVNSDHPYIDTSKFIFFVEEIEKSNNTLEKAVEAEIDLLPDSQKINTDLLELMMDIIGKPYKQSEIDEIEKEGKIRYSKLIPPGFDDFGKKGKDEFRTYGQMTYQLHYGDLLVWKQMLDKVCETESKKPLIFLTEDRKSDWWELDRQDNIKRPHPQLIQEFTDKVGQSFYIYKTDRFVELARKYLDSTLTAEQVQNVSNEVENIRKVEDQIARESSVVALEMNEVIRLVDYLPSYLKEEFDLVLDAKNKKFLLTKSTQKKFIRLIREAIHYAMPKIAREFINTAERLAYYNSEMSQKFIAEYESEIRDLEPEVKVRSLFNMIDYLNDKFYMYVEQEEEMKREWERDQMAEESYYDGYR